MKNGLFCPLLAIFLLTSCHRGANDRSVTSAAIWAHIPSATVMRPGVTLRADPDPIIVHTTSQQGVTTLIWHAPVTKVEIHVGSPGGQLFAAGGSDGRAQTGPWVTNNMVFYLQDATAPKPTDNSATLAMLPVAIR